MSRLGLAFVACYVALSSVSVWMATQANLDFKSLAIRLYAPISLVPQEIFSLLPSVKNEVYTAKEIFLINLTSHYPIGMAFICIFLYALGWSISKAFKNSNLFGYKFTAVGIGGFILGYFLFSKSFMLFWPFFIIIGCIVSWRYSSSNPSIKRDA